MGRKRKNKRKSSPKGRGRVTRKTSRGNPGLVSPGRVTTISSSQFQSDCERVQLRFVDVVAVTPGAANQLTTQNYGINTPRVPERSGSTGVAQGFASYAARYHKYICFGSRVVFRVTHMGDAGTNSPTAVRMSLAPLSAGGGTITNYSDAAVQKYSRVWAFPTQTGTASSTASPSTDPRNMWRGRHSMTVSKIEGEPGLRNNNYEAAVSGDPSLVPTWTFSWADLNPASSASSKPVMLIEVSIYYDCVFFERLQFTNSLVAPRAVVAEEKKSAPPPSLTPRALDLDEDVVLVKRSVFAAPSVAARAATTRSVSLK